MNRIEIAPNYPRIAAPLICQGCRHDRPGSCAILEWVDGWLKFPEGDCYAPTGDRSEVAI